MGDGVVGSALLGLLAGGAGLDVAFWVAAEGLLLSSAEGFRFRIHPIPPRICCLPVTDPPRMSTLPRRRAVLSWSRSLTGPVRATQPS